MMRWMVMRCQVADVVTYMICAEHIVSISYVII